MQNAESGGKSRAVTMARRCKRQSVSFFFVNVTKSVSMGRYKIPPPERGLHYELPHFVIDVPNPVRVYADPDSPRMMAQNCVDTEMN